MSQVIISLIHYFEFQVKLFGPLRQTKIEVKFFTSLWRSLLSCLFVHIGLSSRKYVLSRAVGRKFVVGRPWLWPKARAPLGGSRGMFPRKILTFYIAGD